MKNKNIEYRFYRLSKFLIFQKVSMMDDILYKIRQRDINVRSNREFNNLRHISNDLYDQIIKNREIEKQIQETTTKIEPYQKCVENSALKSDIEKVEKDIIQKEELVVQLEQKIRENIEIIEQKSTACMTQKYRNSKIQEKYDKFQQKLSDLNTKIQEISLQLINNRSTEEQVTKKMNEIQTGIEQYRSYIKSIDSRMDFINKRGANSFSIKKSSLPVQEQRKTETGKRTKTRRQRLYSYDVYKDITNSYDQCISKFNFSNQIYSIDFSRSCQNFAVGGADRSVHVIALDKGAVIANHTNVKNGIMAVNYSPTGNRLLSASFDHIISLYDANTNQLQFSTSLHNDAINDCIFTSDYSFCSAGRDCMIFKFDINKRSTKSFIRCQSTPESIALQSEGSLLISAHRDGKIRYWDMFSDKFSMEFQASRDQIVQVMCDESENMIYTISKSRLITSFDKRIPGHILCQKPLTDTIVLDHMKAAFHKNKIYIGGLNGYLKVLDINKLEEVNRLKSSHQTQICAVGIHPILGTIVTGDVSGCVYIWN